MVDAKHQVVVHAEAYGEAQEHALLVPMLEGTRREFKALGEMGDVLKKAAISADSGFHTEANAKCIATRARTPEGDESGTMGARKCGKQHETSTQESAATRSRPAAPPPALDHGGGLLLQRAFSTVSLGLAKPKMDRR